MNKGPNRKWVGQQTSISQEIKRNLRNYTDAQVLAELLQNADDAGATRVAFMLDERHHGTERLGDLGPEVASLQGPALLCYDDAVFKEENFEGLFHFGVGSKKGDPTQTGRFGLGFNAVYHLTDAPILVSGATFLVLDPQRQYLAGLKDAPAAAPGVAITWANDPAGSMDDLFAAFHSGPEFANCNLAHSDHGDAAVGGSAEVPGTSTSTTQAVAEALTCPACTFTNAPRSTKCAVCETVLPAPKHSANAENFSTSTTATASERTSAGIYPGTLFRFPLRTAAQAATSSLRREASTPAQVAAMLEAFAADGAETALFLQHVCQLEIWRWSETASSPQLLWRLVVTPSLNVQAGRGVLTAAQARANMQLERAALHGWARDELEAWDQQERAIQMQREQQDRKSGKGGCGEDDELEGGWRIQGASLALAQRLRLKGPKAPPRFTLRLRVKIERWSNNNASAEGASEIVAGVLISEKSAAGSRASVVVTEAAEATLPAAVVEDEEWWLRSGVGQGTSWALASSVEAERADHALWPAVTVAARVSRFVIDGSSNSGSSCSDSSNTASSATSSSALNTSSNSSSRREGYFDSHVAVAGHAFAALKLASIPTGWPVHVSARWALSDNRRDLVRGAASSERLDAAWNYALLTDAIPQLWSELLLDLRAAPCLSLSTYYHLWPRFQNPGESPGNKHQSGSNSAHSTAMAGLPITCLFDAAVAPTLAALASLPVLRVIRPISDEPPALDKSSKLSSSSRSFVQIYAHGFDPTTSSNTSSRDSALREHQLMTQRDLLEVKETEWQPLAKASFALGLSCPDLPPLGLDVNTSSGSLGEYSNSSSVGGNVPIVGPADAVLGVSDGVGPPPLVVAAGAAASEARRHWFALVFAYEAVPWALAQRKHRQRLDSLRRGSADSSTTDSGNLGSVDDGSVSSNNGNFTPIAVFRRAGWRLVRWCRHRGARLTSALALSGLENLSVAPSHVLESLRSAARRLDHPHDSHAAATTIAGGVSPPLSSEEQEQQQALRQVMHHAGRFSSQAAESWIAQQGSGGLDRNDMNDLSLKLPWPNSTREALIELILRDESGRSAGNGSSRGDQHHREGAVEVNPPEEARRYSFVWNDDTPGTGHGRSCLGSPQAWSTRCNKEQWCVLDLCSGLPPSVVPSLLFPSTSNVSTASNESTTSNGNSFNDSYNNGEGIPQVVVHGVVLQRRGDKKHNNQRVTKLRAAVSDDGEVWTPVTATSTRVNDCVNGSTGSGGAYAPCGGDEFLVPPEHRGRSCIWFLRPILGRCLRLEPIAWQGHSSMRCGALVSSLVPPPTCLIPRENDSIPFTLSSTTATSVGSLPPSGNNDNHSHAVNRQSFPISGPLLVASSPGQAKALLPLSLHANFVAPSLAQRLLRLKREGSLHAHWFETRAITRHKSSVNHGQTGANDISADERAAAALEEFGVTSLALRLKAVLPFEWEGATCVPWTPPPLPRLQKNCEERGNSQGGDQSREAGVESEVRERGENAGAALDDNDTRLTLGAHKLGQKAALPSASEIFECCDGYNTGSSSSDVLSNFGPDTLWLRRFWRFAEDEERKWAGIRGRRGADGSTSMNCSQSPCQAAAVHLAPWPLVPVLINTATEEGYAATDDVGECSISGRDGFCNESSSTIYVTGGAELRLVRLDLAKCVLRIPRTDNNAAPLDYLRDASHSAATAPPVAAAPAPHDSGNVESLNPGSSVSGSKSSGGMLGRMAANARSVLKGVPSSSSPTTLMTSASSSSSTTPGQSSANPSFDADMEAAIAASLAESIRLDEAEAALPPPPSYESLEQDMSSRSAYDIQSTENSNPNRQNDNVEPFSGPNSGVEAALFGAPPACTHARWSRELTLPAAPVLSPSDRHALRLLCAAGLPILAEADPNSGLSFGLPPPTPTAAASSAATEAKVVAEPHVNGISGLNGAAGLLPCPLFSPRGVLRALAALEAAGLWVDNNEPHERLCEASPEASSTAKSIVSSSASPSTRATAAKATSIASSPLLQFDASAWTSADRNALLAWFSAAALTALQPEELETLQALPLFERASDGKFVAIRGLSHARTVPSDLPGLDLLQKPSFRQDGDDQPFGQTEQAGSGPSGETNDKEDLVLFRRKPSLEAVYEMLGLASLTEEELYTRHVFPCFPTFTEAARLLHLQRALKVADALPDLERRLKFRELAASVPCVSMVVVDGSNDDIGSRSQSSSSSNSGRGNGRNVRLVAAQDLFDPDPRLPFLELLPHKCVPARYCYPQPAQSSVSSSSSSSSQPRFESWLPTLRKLGIATRVNRATFMSLALEVAAASDAVRARALLKLLAKSYRNLATEHQVQEGAGFEQEEAYVGRATDYDNGFDHKDGDHLKESTSLGEDGERISTATSNFSRSHEEWPPSDLTSASSSLSYSTDPETTSFFATIADLPLVRPRKLPDIESALGEYKFGDNKHEMPRCPVVEFMQRFTEMPRNAISDSRSSTTLILVPLSACADYADFDLCWSQRPVLGDSSLYLPNALKQLLGLSPAGPPLHECALHLVYLATVPPTHLLALDRIRPLDRAIDQVYEYLARAITFGVPYEQLDAGGARTKITEILGETKLVFRRTHTTPSTGEGSGAQAGSTTTTMSSFNNLRGGETRPAFVAGSNVFAFLPHPMAPLAWHTRECHRFFHEAYISPSASSSSLSSFSSSSGFYGDRTRHATALAGCFGIRLEPSPQEAAEWVNDVAKLARVHAKQAFYASAGLSLLDDVVPGSLSNQSEADEDAAPAVLPPDHLRLVCHALRTLAALEPSDARAEALATVKAPNSRCELVPARWLLIDDAPWLESRLSPTKLHLAHSLLLRPSEDTFVGNATRKRYEDSHGDSRDGSGISSDRSSRSEDLLDLLGVQSLSRVIEERLAGNFEPLPVSPQPPPLLLWNEALKSSALRHGLRQLIRHEKDESRATHRGMLGGISGNQFSQADGQEGSSHRNSSSRNKSVMERLLELEGVTLQGCRGLETAFWVNGQDVTAPSLHHTHRDTSMSSSLAHDPSSQADPRGGRFGSNFVLISDAESGTAMGGNTTHKLLIDVSSGGGDRLWLNYVVLALKQSVLGGMPRDLLPFAMMLDAVGSSLKGNHSSNGNDTKGYIRNDEPAARAAVGSVLKSHHIADRRLSDHLGLALPRGAVSRLVSAAQLHSSNASIANGGEGEAVNTLFAVGEEVAFRDDLMEISSRTAAENEKESNSISGTSSSNTSSEVGGLFRYGRVVRWVGGNEDTTSGSFTIEDSAHGTSRQVQPSNVFKLHLPPGALSANVPLASAHSVGAMTSGESTVNAAAIDPVDGAVSDATTASTSERGNAAASAAAAGALDEQELQVLKQAAASANTVNRVRYTPPDEEWAAKEASLVRALREDDGIKQRLLEEEVPGTNKVLVKGGFSNPSSSSNSSSRELEAAAKSLSDVTVATARPPSVRKGMDLVRVGNLGETGVAFFFDRRSMPPPPSLLQWLEAQMVPALQEVCDVFNFDARYVTLFHQPGSASRFVRQRILLNTEPVYARHFAASAKHGGNSLEDVRRSSFVWCYLYGVLIHKLGHFHDIVHGTRHDYYMNELRIEYMEAWIDLLERHGFDPAAIETETTTRWMVKQRVPGETVN